MFQEFPDDSKNDDFLNEFRQKIADQSAANFEEKRIEMKRSKSVRRVVRPVSAVCRQQPGRDSGYSQTADRHQGTAKRTGRHGNSESGQIGLRHC